MSGLPPSDQLNVMLLDDDPFVLSSLAMLLEAMGHHVWQATEGEMLLDAASDGAECDVAILDLTNESGPGAKELVPLLRKHYPLAKFVVTSGFIENPVLDNHQKFGFHDKLIKPFGTDQLQDLFKRLSTQS